MKKLILLSLLGAALLEFGAFAQLGGGGTGAPAPITVTVTVAANTPLIAITGNVQVVSVSVVSASTGTINFYDCSTLTAPINGTNYVTTNYVSRVSYPTNYVTSYVGYNGYTNYYTNVGLWSTNVVVPSGTSPLPSLGSFGVIANTVSVYSSPMLFAQGVSVLSSVAGTVIIQYVPNR